MRTFILMFLALLVSITMFGCQQPTETKATTIIVPHLVSPYNGSTNISTTPLFKWNNTAHRIQLALFPSFNTVLYTKDISGTSYQMPSHILQFGMTYFWRVGVVNGNSVFWSAETYYFSTGNQE